MNKHLSTLPDEALKELLELKEAEHRLAIRDAAKEQFMPFVHHVYENFIEGRHHRIIAEKLERVAKGELKRLIVNMPPRHALDIKEKILTTDGWKTIESLAVGDFVYGPDGLPTEVLGKSDVFEDRDLFSVRTDDGCEVVCDGEHLWNVRLDRKQEVYHDYTTEQLFLREQGALIRTKRSGDVEIRTGDVPIRNVRAARLPDVSPVVRLKADLPVDPYVLGVWLGDGAAAQTTFTASDEDARWIRLEFERRGYKTTDRSTPQTFGVDGLKVVLRDVLNVLGNKHIPQQYLLSSIEQRMDLLRGLMDSDGNVSKQGQCFFTQKDPELIRSVRILLWSLGIKNTIQTWNAKLDGKDFGPAFRLSFYAKDCCLLPRKRERTKESSAGRFIRVSKIERKGPTQCIRVAREDGLFLVGEGFCVTHNSKSEFASYLMPAWFLGRNPKLKIIQATHNTELAVRFGRKVRDLISDPHYQQVFPGTQLKEDSKSAGRWETSAKGEYFAAGVGSAVTGRGADLFIIDDPHALEVSTPIPTPNGFVEIQDLKIGDKVFGPDGKPTTVVGKSDVWHNRDLYSVVTSDGEEILCDGGHLWGVNSDTCLAKARVETYTARYLAEWRLKNRPIIPRHQPVEYPEAELPIDPWVLGAWLGDGTSSSGRITAHPDDQPYMMEQFRRAGYSVGGLTACGNTFTVYGLHTQLRDLGVLNNKHVPEQYLTASVEQRMALLQGLMDTDGSVIQTGQCGFYNTNVGLVDAVVELLHSLGVKATRRTYHDKRGRYKTTKPNHRVMFRLENAARMPRKRMHTRTPVDKLSRSITVEPTNAKGSVQCITVDRKDGLFLAGRGYVVTHNSEQDALSENAFDHAYEWYTSGPRQRLQPGGAIILVMTRWGKKDLTGQLLAKQSDPLADQWEVVEFPAILPSDEPLWPEFWSKDALVSIKASLPVAKWSAQWQQQPTASASAIIKKEWWKDWDKKDLPELKYILQAYDTAFSKKETADYSAITTWGVFNPEDGGPDHICLLDARRGRWSFPELKEIAYEEHEYWEPDMVIVEAKATGTPLIDELRLRGIPALGFSPGKGRDKVTRMHMVAPLFEAGVVWAPMHESFADEVIEEVASFPHGDHDDFCDSMTLALMRFRQGGFISLKGEEEDEMEMLPRKREYY